MQYAYKIFTISSFKGQLSLHVYYWKKISEDIIICQIQHFEADFL